MVSCTLIELSFSRLQATARDAGDSREVVDRNALIEAACFQERLYGFLLVISMFDHEPRAGFEVRRGARDEGADRIEAVAAPIAKCGRGLETQVSLGEVRVAVRHVRRIRNHEVESPAGDGRVPRAQ